MRANEIIIKEHARIEYLKGRNLEDIRADINTRHGSAYAIKTFQKWKELDGWDEQKQKRELIISDEQKLEKQLPTYENIKQDALSKIINKRDMLEKFINTENAMGKKPNIAAYKEFRAYNESIIDKSGETIVGKKSDDLAKIIMNFNLAKDQSKDSEVVDVYFE